MFSQVYLYVHFVLAGDLYLDVLPSDHAAIRCIASRHIHAPAMMATYMHDMLFGSMSAVMSMHVRVPSAPQFCKHRHLRVRFVMRHHQQQDCFGPGITPAASRLLLDTPAWPAHLLRHIVIPRLSGYHKCKHTIDLKGCQWLIGCVVLTLCSPSCRTEVHVPTNT